jgi:hypothetical protein
MAYDAKELERRFKNAGRSRKGQKKSANGDRNIYVWERMPHKNKKYLMVFWFKDETDSHL